MEDGEVVGGDKQMDGVEVILGAFGEGVSAAHQAASSGPQNAKPAFDVVGFAFVFAAAAVGVFGESPHVSLPEIAARGATPLAFGQCRVEVTRTLQTPVAERPSHDLARSPAQRHPEPKLAGFAADKAPEFIQFEHVAVLAGQQRVHEGGQARRFFPPPSAR